MKTPKKIITPKYLAAGPKTVCLTFDDGPHPTHTGKVLDTLSAHGISACFFVVGKNAALYPKLLERIAREGHRIGNHSYSHKQLTKLTAAQIRDELRRTDRLIAPYVQGPKLFRPPYGAHNATVDSVSSALGYRTIIWNVDTVDWNRAYQPTKWVTHGIAQIRARQSSVVLNHDIQGTTAANLDSFIRRIKAIGNIRFLPATTV